VIPVVIRVRRLEHDGVVERKFEVLPSPGDDEKQLEITYNKVFITT
jgi:hypothetical protein